MSSYGYKSEVTISHERDGKRFGYKTHNNGTSDLFWYFAKALCWDDVSDYKPRYLDLGYIGADKEFHTVINESYRPMIKPLLVKKLHSSAEGAEGDWTAYVVGSIPYESLDSSIGSHSDAVGWYLRLLSNYRESSSYDFMELARVKLDSAPNIVRGTQLYVEWDMWVQNAGDDSSSASTTNTEV